MKKLLFLSLLFLLAGFRLAAQPALGTVSGHVLRDDNNAPLEGWTVWQQTDPADSTNQMMAVTDANGFYTMPILPSTDPNGGQTVTVYTYDGCTGVVFAQIGAVVNDVATVDFRVCMDFPGGWNDCGVWAWSDWPPTNGGLTYQMHASAWSYTDSLATFTYTWTLPDGTVLSGADPSYTFSSEGYYAILVTAVSDVDSCVSTSVLDIYVDELYTGPTQNVTVSGFVTDVEDGSPLSDIWVSAVGVVDPWAGGWGVTGADGFYTFTATLPEADTEVTVSTYDFCTFIQLLEIVPIVNSAAQADFAVCFEDSFPPVPGCSAFISYLPTNTPQEFQFYADVWNNGDSTGLPLVYFWDFGDGTTSTEANPTHIYAVDGIYTVTLTVTDSTGCVAYACEIICTFNGGGIDTFYYGCQAMFWVEYFGADPAGQNVVSFYDASFGAAQNWAWDFGDGNTSTEQNPVHVYAAEGTYTVTLHITTLDGCESTVTMEVWIGNNPWNEWDCQAMFLPVPDSMGGFFFYDLSYSPTPITAWTWDFGDGSTSTEQNPSHTYTQDGIYTVSLTIEADSSCNSVFSFDLDTENPFNFGIFSQGGPSLGLAAGVSATDDTKLVFEKAKTFPNPASSEMTLAFQSREARTYELRISDLAGQTVFSKIQEAVAGANATRVNVQNLPAGLYLAQLRSNEGVQTLKFSVAKQ